MHLVPNNSGKARPPPFFGQSPKEKIFSGRSSQRSDICFCDESTYHYHACYSEDTSSAFQFCFERSYNKPRHQNSRRVVKSKTKALFRHLLLPGLDEKVPVLFQRRWLNEGFESWTGSSRIKNFAKSRDFSGRD